MIKVGDKVRLKSWLGSKFYEVVKIDEKHVYLDITGFCDFPYSVHHDWIIEKPLYTADFKPGDKVNRKDGKPFSNNEKILTVSRITCENDVWFQETNTFLPADKLELVTPDATTTSEPFRTVTKRELKPGRYGRVRISDTLQVRVEAVNTVEQLDEVIHTLNQIREVLSDA